MYPFPSTEINGTTADVANIKKYIGRSEQKMDFKFLVMENRKLSCISLADLEFLVGEIFALTDTTCIWLLFLVYFSSNLPIYLKHWFRVVPLKISQMHSAMYLFSAKMLNSAQIL